MPGTEGERMPAALRISLIALAVAAGALLAFRWTYEPDLFWHLAQGREIAAGRLVHTNLFSAAHPEYPQPATSWLFDLGAYALWQIGGAAAIQVAQTLVVALALALAFAAARTRASLPAALAVLALAFFMVEPRALPRPHTVSLAGIAACALLVERARRRRSAAPLLYAVPLMALWSNLHVESFFGLLLLALFAAGELARPAALPSRQALAAAGVVVLAAAATSVNPYGLGLLRYLWENASVPSVIRIAELQPPYLPNYAPFFAYLVCGTALLLRRPRRLALSDGLVFMVFAALALRHLRFTALFACATTPVVAAYLTPLVRGRGEGRALVAASVFTGLLLCRLSPTALVGQLGAGAAALLPPDIIPVGAAEFARNAGLVGPVFNSNNLGGYLVWAGYPDVRVFQDSRLQAYPATHFQSIMQAYRSQAAWDELVAGVDWAVLSRPRPNELSGAGRFPRDQWATVYWDEAAEVLVRRSGAYAGLLAAFEYTAFFPEVDPMAPLAGDRVARVAAEARRNARENPLGFAAPAMLCLQDDAASCAAAEQLAAEHPWLRRAAARLRAARVTRG
jgi:hypothetical protein